MPASAQNGRQALDLSLAATGPPAVDAPLLAPFVAGDTGARLSGRLSISSENNGQTIASDGDGVPILVLTSEETLDRSIKFNVNDIAIDYGTLDVSFGAASQSLADTLTIDRLLTPGAFDGANRSTTYAGFKAQLFDRVTFAVRIMIGERTDAASTAFRAAEFDTPPDTKIGAAMWDDFTVKLIDDGDLHWSVSAQFGMVDAELSVPPGARLRGSPLIAGTRAYVMTRADYDGLVLSAATQSVNGPTRDQQSQRVTLGFRGGQTTLYSRNFSLGPAAGDTQSTGATVELYGQDLVSSDLAPSLLSVTVQSERSSSPSSQMQGSMASADLAWSTRWGETIVSYWQDQKTGTDVFGAAAECDRLIDISQQFSIGHWRGSLGADYQSFASASNRGGSDESGLSGHTSFAYAVPGAPELKFGIERRKEDAFFEDFLAPSHSTALDLSLGIDFTPYLQSELASGQVHASLEYRRQLRGDRSKTARDEQEATDALLVSFSAPL